MREIVGFVTKKTRENASLRSAFPHCTKMSLTPCTRSCTSAGTLIRSLVSWCSHPHRRRPVLHKECWRQLDRSPCGHIHPRIGSNVNSRNSQKCKADHNSCIPCGQQLRHSSSSRRILQKCTGQMMSRGESYARTLRILAPHPSLRCTPFHLERIVRRTKLRK